MKSSQGFLLLFVLMVLALVAAMYIGLFLHAGLQRTITGSL